MNRVNTCWTRCAPGLLIGLAGALAGPGAQAQLVTSCDSYAWLEQSSPNTSYSGQSQPGKVACSSSVNLPDYGRAVAQGDAAAGVLKLNGSADTLNQQDNLRVQAQSGVWVSFEDTVRLNAPGISRFEQGTITLAFQYNGFFQRGGEPGQASRGTVVACVSTQTGVIYGGQQCSINGQLQPMLTRLPRWMETPGEVPDVGIPVNAQHTVTLPFSFNRDMDIGMWMWVQTWVVGPEASVIGAFGNSAYWGGILEVRAPDGTVLTRGTGPGTYTMVSSSGIDWHQPMTPVPEPGTALLAALGTAVLGLRLRRASLPHATTRLRFA